MGKIDELELRILALEKQAYEDKVGDLTRAVNRMYATLVEVVCVIYEHSSVRNPVSDFNVARIRAAAKEIEKC